MKLTVLPFGYAIPSTSSFSITRAKPVYVSLSAEKEKGWRKQERDEE